MAQPLGFDYEGPYLRIPSAGRHIDHVRPLNKLLPRVVELDLEWTHQTPTVFSLTSAISLASVMYRPFSIYDPDFNRGISEYSVQGFKELAAAGYTHYYVKWAEIHFQVTGSSTSGSNQAIYMFMIPKKVNDSTYSDLTLLQHMRWVESPGMTKVKKVSQHTQDMTGEMRMRFTPGYYWPSWSASTDIDNWGTITYNSATGASGTNPTNAYEVQCGLVADQVPGASMGFNGHISIRMHTIVWRQNAIFPTWLAAKIVPYATWHAAAGYEETSEVAGGPPGVQGDEETGTGAITDLEPALAWTDDP